jgi:diguanylate cyclase (GGDEF)-like protein
VVPNVQAVRPHASVPVVAGPVAGSDPLTGLADRAVLELRVAAEVARACRDGTAVALVFADLNEFKRVNDGLGHDAGDRLLCQVADRLRATIRPEDLAARLGGDEFVVLVTGLPVAGREPAEAMGQRIADALAEPYTLGAAELIVDASVGVSLFPSDADGPDALVKHADAAMYEAKAAGGGVAVYGGGTVDPIEHLALAARLRRAVERDELVLHYQPIFRLADRRIIGVEALVRWRDPERGLIPPDEFIPVAERVGVIDALGDWVLRALCAQARSWQDRGLLPNFGINISPRQLRRAGFARRFAEQVAAHGLDPGRFVLELTESAWALESSRLMPVLEELRGHGLSLAIDDFGAGYSSLWRLRELPVHVIKVDRSFLCGVPEDEQSTRIFAAMLRLADACGCDVVAEGVEEVEQLDFLASEGCRLAQGFHLGRPLMPDELELRLEASIAPERRRARD